MERRINPEVVANPCTLASGDTSELTPKPDLTYTKLSFADKGVRMSRGQGEDGESRNDLTTARGRDWPSVRQYNVFVENRVGNLLTVVRHFESTDIRIVALTVVESADCAIIRIVLSDPERAREIFEQARLPITESDLLVVELPEGNQPLVTICKALLGAELSIHYAYPLMVGPQGRRAVALHVEDHETAVATLTARGFTLFTENDLSEEAL
jgi:hypothetical protein